MEAEAVNPRRDYDLRTNPQAAAERERQERAETERRRKRTEFIRKKEQYEKNISRGVNIPQPSAYQMQRAKEGLSDLFRGELNPILKQMMPRTGGQEEWAYEECMHRIRKHIRSAIGRDSKRLYGERHQNPNLHAATEQLAEILIEIQQVRRDLKGLKDLLHKIAETGREMTRREGEGEREEERVETRRSRRRFANRITPILNLLTPETIREYFGTHGHEDIHITNIRFRDAER
jgi:hypothetical protein